MAETTQFDLVSPARLLLSEPVEMVVVPGTEGDFGALPRHAPMIAMVRPGVIEVYEDGKVKQRIFVAGGFAEVTEERCTVLAEEAMPVEDLTGEMVEGRISEARDAIGAADNDTARANAEQAMAVALAMKAALAPSTH